MSGGGNDDENVLPMSGGGTDGGNEKESGGNVGAKTVGFGKRERIDHEGQKTEEHCR